MWNHGDMLQGSFSHLNGRSRRFRPEYRDKGYEKPKVSEYILKVEPTHFVNELAWQWGRNGKKRLTPKFLV